MTNNKMTAIQTPIPGATRTIPLPSWLPAEIRTTLVGQPAEFTLPLAVRRRLRRPEKIRVSEWAARNRVVTEANGHPGPWRHEHALHTVKIMDTFGQPHVREIWFCGVEQSGKTNTALNCLAWCIDCDPGNIFYLMPNEKDMDKVTSKKLKPTLTASPRLSRYLSGRKGDTTLSMIQLNHGVTIFPAHAGSASSMATWAAKHCFSDETDKYEAHTGKEADPVTLLKKRNRIYRGRYKRFYSSTPAGRYIYPGLLSCDQIWEWRNRCPHCWAMIKMAPEHLDLPADATPEQIERGNVHYNCQHCGTQWDEAARQAAIRAGAWTCVKGETLTRPAKVGFHHRAWECLDVPLREIAAAYLRSKTGNLNDLIAWANGYEAVDYELADQTQDEDQLLLLRDDRPEGVVPTWADALEISIDTQKYGFWYRIRAWEYGTLTSALVKCGFVETFAALDAMIYDSTWPDAAGNEHRIMSGIIDSQGSPEGGFSTAQVYDWCRRPGGIILPAKGSQGRRSIPVKAGNQDFYPGTNKAIPGGLKLYHIDTHFHKDELARRLNISPGDPGCFYLHSGYSAGQLQDIAKHGATPGPHNLKPYIRQMCAEAPNEKGLWELPKNRPNHLWDCESNGLALVLYLGWQHLTKPNEDPQPATTPRVARSKYMTR